MKIGLKPHIHDGPIPSAIVHAGVRKRLRERVIYDEAELISERFEAVQRYVELLTGRVQQLGTAEDGPAERLRTDQPE